MPLPRCHQGCTPRPARGNAWHRARRIGHRDPDRRIPRDLHRRDPGKDRLVAARQRDALVRAFAAPLPELVAEDVRLAIRQLGRITGRVDVEDLLDVIFKDFCIGK